jgi:rare lipoprotein A
MNFCAIILFFTLSSGILEERFSEEGKASFYADSFQGRKTANGEKYDRKKLTAAHSTLPFNTLVQVTNTRNGKTITVRINDRMRASPHKIIDLSRAAAAQIDLVREGIGKVRVLEVEENTPAAEVLPLNEK